MGVVWAVCHFRHYIYGHRCDVFTDHEVFKTLLNTPHPSGKLARWELTLQKLDLHIHYRPGLKNTNADALLWCPINGGSEEEVQQVASLRTYVVFTEGGTLTWPSDKVRTLHSHQSSASSGTRHFWKGRKWLKGFFWNIPCLLCSMASSTEFCPMAPYALSHQLQIATHYSWKSMLESLEDISKSTRCTASSVAITGDKE